MADYCAIGDGRVYCLKCISYCTGYVVDHGASARVESDCCNAPVAWEGTGYEVEPMQLYVHPCY